MTPILPEHRTLTFRVELGYISDPMLRQFTEHMLRTIPEYFYRIPASSSGKYHPTYGLGEGGLVRHTKAAVRIFHELCEAGIDEWYMNRDSNSADVFSKEKFDDEIIVALLLHDSCKMGAGEIDADELRADREMAATTGEYKYHTIHEHPLVAAGKIIQEAKWLNYPDLEQIKRITDMISSHMGKWNMSRYSSVMLPTPDQGTWGNKLVHLCDYLASRKCLEFNFDANRTTEAIPNASKGGDTVGTRVINEATERFE